jgi:hypothetical protein
MHRILLSLALVGALAAPAAAAPDPFETFVANLAKDPKAAAARYKDCDLLVLPSGEARTPCTLALADLGVPGATLKMKHVKITDVPQSMIEYLEADVDALVGGKKVASFHVVEIGSAFNEAGDFIPYAGQWARMISDADATKAAKAGKLPKPPAIQAHVVEPKDAHDEELNDFDEGAHEMQGWLSGGDLKEGLAGIAADEVVFGSAPGQRYSGKSAAKQIKGWKLGLLATGGAAIAGNSSALFGATQVVGTLPDKTTITYVALVAYSARIIQESGDHVWVPRVVSFGVPQ